MHSKKGDSSASDVVNQSALSLWNTSQNDSQEKWVTFIWFKGLTSTLKRGHKWSLLHPIVTESFMAPNKGDVFHFSSAQDPRLSWCEESSQQSAPHALSEDVFGFFGGQAAVYTAPVLLLVTALFQFNFRRWLKSRTNQTQLIWGYSVLYTSKSGSQQT